MALYLSSKRLSRRKLRQQSVNELQFFLRRSYVPGMKCGRRYLSMSVRVDVVLPTCVIANRPLKGPWLAGPRALAIPLGPKEYSVSPTKTDVWYACSISGKVGPIGVAT